MSVETISGIQNKSNQLVQPAIENIPKDITLLFFKCLSMKELSRVSRVCKEWRFIATDSSLYDLKTLFPSLNIIDERDWKKHVNLKNLEIEVDDSTVDVVSEREFIFNLAKKLEELAPVKIEDNAGWTLLTIPKNASYHVARTLVNTLTSGFEFCESFQELDEFLVSSVLMDKVKSKYRILISNNVLQESRG